MKTEAEELPSDVNEQEFNDDVLKQESEVGETESTSSNFRKFNKVTPEMVSKLSEILKEDWRALAAKFGYQADEVLTNSNNRIDGDLRPKRIFI